MGDMIKKLAPGHNKDNELLCLSEMDSCRLVQISHFLALF